MGKLGKKINHKFHKLGKKVDHGVHKMGQKTNNVIHKIEQRNDKIISKSGKALNVANKVLGIGDKILSAANDAGLSTVPGIGTVSKLAETGLHKGHQGVKKLGKMQKAYADASHKALAKAHGVGNTLEKHNTRKMLANMAEDDNTFV